jgi:hypothetical protein
MAYYTVEWEVKHTHYAILLSLPSLTLLLWIIPISILFGLAAMLFPEVPIIGGHYFQSDTYILRYVHSWAVLYLHLPYFTGATKYLGLGVPIIIESFLTLVNIMTFTQDFVY